MYKVIKSGGESTGTAKKIHLLRDYVEQQSKLTDKIVLVVSAPAADFRITEELRNLYNGKGSKEKIESHFIEMSKELGVPFNPVLVLWENLNKAKTLDDFLFRGEHANAYLVNAFLITSGLKSQWVDTRSLIKIGNKLTLDRTPLGKGVQVHVIGGFYGSDRGKTKLLPIGGSDITAGFLAGELNASEYVNLKEVPGISVVDPKILEETKQIRHASFAEIRELLYRSRKSTLEPTSLSWCRKEGIPVRVKSLNSPFNEGTKITNSRDLTLEEESPIVGIASKEDFVVYNFTRKENTFFDKVFRLFKQHLVSIDMVDTNNGNVSIAIHNSELKAKREEIDRRLLDLCRDIDIYDNQTLISIVGEGITKPITFKNWITEDVVPETIAAYGPILGGSQKAMTVFYIELFGMHDQVGYAQKLSRFFKENHLEIAASSTSIDSFSIGVEPIIPGFKIRELCNGIESRVGADTISVTRNGVHRFGPTKDVRNITIAVPNDESEEVHEAIYNSLVTEGLIY